jgi:hypothetical protein
VNHDGASAAGYAPRRGGSQSGERKASIFFFVNKKEAKKLHFLLSVLVKPPRAQ